MKGQLISHNRNGSNCYGRPRPLRRLMNWTRQRAFISGCLLLFCALLVVLGARNHFNSDRIETNKAQAQLVRKMRNYSSDSTNVAIIIPKVRSDDVRWLQKHLQTQLNTTPFIYSMSSRRETDLLIPHSTRGREVSAYLSYIIDYYDKLPPFSIFLHAGESQRHNDLFGLKTKAVLDNLRLEAVEAKGYVNLRCQHSPGCPTHVHPNNPTELDIKNHDTRAYFAQIYKGIFGDVPVPDAIGGICCAQFAVSRDQIRRRPKSDYIRMMNWVDKGSKETVDDYGVGWVFEVVWHVVFSMEDVHCPVYEQCRCDNYGWCGPLSSGETLMPISALGNQTMKG